MRFLLLPLLAASFCATAQPKPADTSFRLLWFTGKKLGANTLLRAGGDTVFYQPTKNSLRYAAKKGSGNRLAAIQAELNRTPQRTNEMASRFAAALPKAFAVRLSVPLQQAFSGVESNWKEAVSNVYELPPLPARTADKSASAKGGPSADFEAGNDETLDEFIAEAKAYLAQLRTQKITWVPSPPREELEYWRDCDGFNDERLKREREEFEEQFYVAEERKMTERVLVWERRLQLLGSQEELKKMDGVFEETMGLMEERFMQRARMLIDQYLDKPEYHGSILPVVFSIERQRQLLGRTDDHLGSLMEGLSEKIFTIMDGYLEKAAREYNYGVMLNSRMILSAERQRQLLGSAKGVDLLQRYLDFNRFKLSINVSTKLGGVDYRGDYAYIVSQLRGDNYFVAVPNEACQLDWVLVGPDKDKMKFKLETGEIISPITVNYTGTKDWYTEKPTLSLDFSAADPDDTAIIRAFTPVGLKESWVYPEPLGLQHYPNIAGSIATCFIDKDRMMEEARELNMAKVEKMKKEMMAKHSQFMQYSKGLRGKDPSKMSPAEMARMTKALQAADGMMQDIQLPVTVGSFLVKTRVANRNRVVFREKLDGRELFPENSAIQYAYFHIQLEQDPGSPYKIVPGQ